MVGSFENYRKSGQSTLALLKLHGYDFTYPQIWGAGTQNDQQTGRFFDSALDEIVRNMLETMYGSPGIGLAAPQVGLNIQLTTIDLSVGEDKNQLITICNPVIIEAEGEQKSDEGCLSLPEFSESVIRPKKIAVRGQKTNGDEIIIEAEGTLARCFSHEIDHLNGILFIDHLSPLKRSLIKNKIRKMIKAGEW